MLTEPNDIDLSLIQTQRLIGCSLTLADFKTLWWMNQNPKIMATLGGVRDAEMTQRNLHWNLAQWHEQGFGMWLWYDKANGKLVGRGGLRKISIQKREEIEVGYALVPEYWGQGFATEIATTCVELGFLSLRLPRLVCHTTLDNQISQRVMRKVGFTFEGYFSQHEQPHILYSLSPHHYWKTKIAFKPLTEADLDLLVTWLAKPHVKAWWDDELNEAQIRAKYAARIGCKRVVGFIMWLHDRPLGFIQYYVANQVGDGWWPDEVEGTVGIDQFIGEEAYLNKGYGTMLISAFTEKLWAMPGVKKIIVDVAPDNLRAVRCYQKVGFAKQGLIQTPDGKALLMTLTKNTSSS